MTYRQSILKAIYPLIMLPGKLFGSAKAIQKNTSNKLPAQSIYDLELELNNGTKIRMDQFKGKKMLFVNTASDCGYTGQYEALEQLHKQYGSKLVVIGFPANDFKDQEKKDDAAIAEFCKINYGVSFLLAKKSSVIKGSGQNPLFAWLSHAEQNGWCNQQPVWNFSKYLVNETGVLTHFFAQTVSPLDAALTDQIQ
ncbi:MAG: glutathione peroxidase [Chitinophagaceae bacterium BSSC1]|nr:MAG: glutathione peroxidase [Chitinophagaceae bacterium BSSC1]